MKTGLILEGGGMRGVYTIGVLDCIMQLRIHVDYVIGVSAGACHGASFVSRQPGRSLRVNQAYLADKRYISVENFCRTGSLFGMDFIFDEIPNRLDPFDAKTFYESPTEFVVGVTDLQTGKPAFFDKSAIDPKNILLRASSSIPCCAPPVPFRGRLYLDGGTSAPIPLDKALQDGCDRLIIVLTRDRSYEKKPEPTRRLCRHLYKEYPAFISCIEHRHETYNRQLDQVRRLEREGKAIVIAPTIPVKISRFENDMKKLMPLYQHGILDAQIALSHLKQ